MCAIYSNTHLCIPRCTERHVFDTWTNVDHTICFSSALFSVANTNSFGTDRQWRVNFVVCESAILSEVPDLLNLRLVLCELIERDSRRNKDLLSGFLVRSKLWSLDVVGFVSLILKNRDCSVQFLTRDAYMNLSASTNVDVLLFGDLVFQHVRRSLKNVDFALFARSKQRTH